MPINGLSDYAFGQEITSRYEDIIRISPGAMALVWKAKHRVIGQWDVLKVSNDRTDCRRARLVSREIRALGLIEHPGVAAIREVYNDNGTDVIALRYVEGPTMTEWLRSGQDVIDVCAAIIAITHTMQWVHSHRIVHRDLKPSNIIMGKEGPVVVDLGLACILDSDETKTASNIYLGTPRYSAPEQSGGRYDPRLDVYSLGMVLCEAITGHLPFENCGAAEQIRRKKHDEPFMPGSDIQDIPEELQTIICRAIARLPAERYQSMSEFGADLESFLKVRGLNPSSYFRKSLPINHVKHPAAVRDSPVSFPFGLIRYVQHFAIKTTKVCRQLDRNFYSYTICGGFIGVVLALVIAFGACMGWRIENSGLDASSGDFARKIHDSSTVLSVCLAIPLATAIGGAGIIRSFRVWWDSSLLKKMFTGAFLQAYLGMILWAVIGVLTWAVLFIVVKTICVISQFPAVILVQSELSSPMILLTSGINGIVVGLSAGMAYYFFSWNFPKQNDKLLWAMEDAWEWLRSYVRLN